MAHQKREATSGGDEEWVSKRPKVVGAAAEKEHILTSDASQETNGDEAQRGDASQKEKTASMNPCVSDDKATTNSNVSSEQEVTLTSVEADSAEDKGCRHTMEDAWVLLPDASMESPGNLRCAHFAIYDGHGGCLAAEYAQKHLHQNVIAAGWMLKLQRRPSLKVFVELMSSYCKKALGNWQDGATAVCVWVLGQTVFVANDGNAKAVLAHSTSTDGEGAVDDTKSQMKAIVLTREHKAIFPQESARIQKVTKCEVSVAQQVRFLVMKPVYPDSSPRFGMDPRRLIILSIIGDVSIDSEAPMMTSLISRYTGPVS